MRLMLFSRLFIPLLCLLSFPAFAQQYTNGILPDIADPHVLQHNGMYYLYGTHTGGAPNGIPVYTSKDMVNWQYRGWALSRENSWGNHSFWAPEVIHHNGQFYMYYAVEEHLAVATSSSPLGPFRQSTQRPMHSNVKEIDAHVFIDDNGKKYFYFVRFTNGNEIWGAELNDDMLSIKENTMRFIMGPSQAWENSSASPVARVNEGAFVIKHNGRYYMTFSANHFASPDYGVGYAVADNPLGPYYKYDGNPILQSNNMVHGAGHHSITRSPDGSEMFMVYHRHHSLNRIEPRRLAIDKMWFDGDVLRVDGPSIRPKQYPSGSKMPGQTAGIDSGGIYKLIAEHSGKALEVIASQTQNGANVQQWEDNGARTQQWRVDWMGDGYYKLTNVNSGKCLDVDAASLDEAHNVHQWQDNGNNAQRWKIVRLSNGNYKLIAKNSGFALDVTGLGMNNGTNVIQWPDGGSIGAAQHWKFVKVGGANPTVRLQSSNFPNAYVRHYNSRAQISSSISPREDAMFIVVPGLAGSGVSLESVNFPGHFLRHQNSGIFIHVNDGSPLFAADATFNEVPGLADSAASSFQSYNFPDRYIRHRDGLLRIDTITSELARQDATFKKVNP
ncbi:Extracellular exo-alpha-(1-_5)-L-arabinofuranosidase [Thalassocella blandensis]|nr:Extracellular exo-alpha-(1->5)-L-arabinofuranosidase [Thalassocella blandensis]